jgi:hypothetical protein
MLLGDFGPYGIFSVVCLLVKISRHVYCKFTNIKNLTSS